MGPGLIMDIEVLVLPVEVVESQRQAAGLHTVTGSVLIMDHELLEVTGMDPGR
jgi:hypothetical protein